MILAGLDLVDVGQDNVTLRLSKQAVRRHLQFALQALAAVFGEHRRNSYCIRDFYFIFIVTILRIKSVNIHITDHNVSLILFNIRS